MTHERGVEVHRLGDDGMFPNNPAHPLLVYRDAFDLRENDDPAAEIERVFMRNGWVGAWRNGIYDFAHYHSTAHEVLGCYGGWARVRFGGSHGVATKLSAGDAVVIPAGVAHERLAADAEFRVVGTYAGGRDYDMNCGRATERPAADHNIASIPLPDCDPIFGAHGPLKQHWTWAAHTRS
jgi:uncharacterized protein YjlB